MDSEADKTELGKLRENVPKLQLKRFYEQVAMKEGKIEGTFHVEMSVQIFGKRSNKLQFDLGQN
jgi:hypothetical protein